MTAQQNSTIKTSLLDLLEALHAGSANFPPLAQDEDREDTHTETAIQPVAAKVSAQRCATDLLVEVDLPGVRPSDVSVKVDKDGIHVQGLRAPLDEYTDRQTIVDEADRGMYEAHLRLNHKISPDDLNAVLENGVLEIYIQDVFDQRVEEFTVPVEHI